MKRSFLCARVLGESVAGFQPPMSYTIVLAGGVSTSSKSGTPAEAKSQTLGRSNALSSFCTSRSFCVARQKVEFDTVVPVFAPAIELFALDGLMRLLEVRASTLSI